MTITLSPRYSRLRHSPGSAISLSWQTTCGAARRNAFFSAVEELGVVIEPARQAHAVERIRLGSTDAKLRRHLPDLPREGPRTAIRADASAAINAAGT